MKTFTCSSLVGICLCLVLLQPSQTFAAGSGDSTIQRVDSDYNKAEAAIERQDWDKAIELLNASLAREANNADAYNLLGFAERKRGNLDAAFSHYDRALALDPKHRGAHEYIGEAYLLTGNLAKAEEHLQQLDKLCFFPCDEYSELKAAIKEYKVKQGK